MPPDLPQSLPPPEHYAPPGFPVPPGACDAHTHIVPASGWQLVPDASYEPAPAPPPAHRAMRKALKLDRGVIVQPSIFGTDNSALLSALAEEPQRLRGEAVVAASTSDAELERLHAAGVRGLRFVFGSLGGGQGLDALIALAPRIVTLGWHAEILLREKQWTEYLDALLALPCTLVIDHMGSIPAEVGPDQAAVRAMRRLVVEHGAWVKLIGYRLSKDPADPRITERARLLIADAPEHMVWGSDWPHVFAKPMPDAGLLLGSLDAWVQGDASLRQRILADNPARLFDFPAAGAPA